MKNALRLLLVLFPWVFRRRLLQALFGYELHPESRIGLAWIFPQKLTMARGSSIGHLTVAKGMDLLELGEQASIGRLNWISAMPSGNARYFTHLTARQPQLVIAEHAAITNRHIIDCTERVVIGRYATFAGFRSQILTHSIDLDASRQHARPVVIGEYCFVGTACTILGGSVLPDYSVLGANALLNKVHYKVHHLYAGVPAEPVAPLDPGMRYFTRTSGFVN